MDDQFVTPNTVLSVFPVVLENGFLNALARPLCHFELKFLFEGVLTTVQNGPTPPLGRILVDSLS